MIEFSQNPAENLILTKVVEFDVNFSPNIMVKYHFAVVFQYFPVMLGKKLTSNY